MVTLLCLSFFLFVLFLTEDSEAIRTLSPGAQRNTVLFQGFCVMKYTIYALCVNAHKYSNCSECESMHHQQQHLPTEAETDQTQTSTSSEGMSFPSVAF